VPLHLVVVSQSRHRSGQASIRDMRYKKNQKETIQSRRLTAKTTENLYRL
jgi:hypothetical protein